MSTSETEPIPATDWGEPRSKTITWHLPRLVEGIAEMSGIEYLQGIIDGRFPPPPIASLFGMELVSVSPGEAVFSAVPDDSMLNPLGLVHGGTLCTLMDTAMGVAVQTEVPATVGYATIELKVSYLRPLPFDGRRIEVRGRTLQVGSRIAFAEAHAYAGEQLVGHSTTSLAAVAAAR
jgi:uncharacterized protein (TIGR00369 family)